MFGIGLSALAYSLVLAIRYWFGGAQGISQAQTFRLDDLWSLFIKPFLQHPQPFAWPLLLIVMVGIPALWIWKNRRRLIKSHYRLLLCASLIGLCSITLATITELRILIPSITILVFVAVRVEELNAYALETPIKANVDTLAAAGSPKYTRI